MARFTVSVSSIQLLEPEFLQHGRYRQLTTVGREILAVEIVGHGMLGSPITSLALCLAGFFSLCSLLLITAWATPKIG